MGKKKKIIKILDNNLYASTADDGDNVFNSNDNDGGTDKVPLNNGIAEING